MKLKIPAAILILFFSLLAEDTFAQQITKKVTQKKYENFKDSLIAMEYPYILPFWAEKVMDKGFDMPYPGGMGLNYFWQRQDVNLNNLAVSFGESEDIDLSDLVEFEYITSTAQSISFRPDIYIFPFLNVYAIVNQVWSYTDVKVSVPFELVVPRVYNQGTGGGFGLSLAGGIGPGWVAVNTNFAWTKLKNLETPTQSFVSALRFGMTKYFGNRRQRIAFWVGANYQSYVSDSRGSYDMLNLIPDDKERLEELKDNVDEVLDGLNDNYEEWCNSPGNRPKCEVLDPILEEFRQAIQDKIDGIEPPDELRINYAFNATPAQKWNMLAGLQYHASRRFQFRGEVGFLGGRRTYLVSANYRFGLKVKNL
jgi:hypothetical protein